MFESLRQTSAYANDGRHPPNGAPISRGAVVFTMLSPVIITAAFLLAAIAWASSMPESLRPVAMYEVWIGGAL